MTELLLYNGAPVDQDSSYGRINAVMVACQKKNMEMLKLLILYKADLSKPTHVERKDKFGRKYTVLLHPIFVASTISSKFLEVNSLIVWHYKEGILTYFHSIDNAGSWCESQCSRSCFRTRVW